MPAIKENFSRVNREFTQSYTPEIDSFNEKEYQEYIELSKPKKNPDLLSMYSQASQEPNKQNISIIMLENPSFRQLQDKNYKPGYISEIDVNQKTGPRNSDQRNRTDYDSSRGKTEKQEVARKSHTEYGANSSSRWIGDSSKVEAREGLLSANSQEEKPEVTSNREYRQDFTLTTFNRSTTSKPS